MGSWWQLYNSLPLASSPPTETPGAGYPPGPRYGCFRPNLFAIVTRTQHFLN